MNNTFISNDNTNDNTNDKELYLTQSIEKRNYFIYRNNVLTLLKDIPKLEVYHRVGGTGYIDFLTFEEVKEPIMWGIDKYFRIFIVIKMIEYKTHIPRMQIFFQRYSGINYNWNSGNNYTIPIFSTQNGLTNEQFEFLYDIITKKSATLKEEHCYNHYLKFDKIQNCIIGETIYLYDEKKIDAAKIIQKAWRKCRYEPSFKMCEIVQINNLINIEKEYNKSFVHFKSSRV